MIQIVAGNDYSCIMLFAVLFEHMFDNGLRTGIEEVERFVEYQQLRIMKHGGDNATVIIYSHNLNHTIDVCPRIALLENGVIIRDIMNENNSAEKELEDYFNVEE